MAKARIKNWSAGEVLTAANLNAEFNNVIDSPMDLISPATAALDMNAQELILDLDGDSSLTADTENIVDLKLQNFDAFIFDGSVASPMNGLTFASTETAVNPTITAHGETNVGMNLVPKGTGVVQIDGNTAYHAGNWPSFKSAEPGLAITLSSINSFPHGLGVVPTVAGGVLMNAVTQYSYGVGDKVSFSNATGIGVSADATYVNVVVGSAVQIYRLDTPALGTITATSWKLVVFATV